MNTASFSFVFGSVVFGTGPTSPSVILYDRGVYTITISINCSCLFEPRPDEILPRPVEAILHCGFAFVGSTIPAITRTGNTAYLTSSGVQNFVLTISTIIDTTLTGVQQLDFKYITLSLGNINRISSNGSAMSVISNLVGSGIATIYKQ
jgi:hypothetical protein